jgi:hypothetical protein
MYMHALIASPIPRPSFYPQLLSHESRTSAHDHIQQRRPLRTNRTDDIRPQLHPFTILPPCHFVSSGKQ